MYEPSERIYLQEDNILVSDKRILVYGSLYPTANITRVGIFSEGPLGCIQVIAVIGIISSIFHLVTNPETRLTSLIFIVFFIGAIIYLPDKITTYTIEINAGEQKFVAYKTKNKKLAEKIVFAINQAIADR